jgi:hypothetical protein
MGRTYHGERMVKPKFYSRMYMLYAVFINGPVYENGVTITLDSLGLINQLSCWCIGHNRPAFR